MVRFFETDAKSIELLDAHQLTKLLQCLLHCESRSNGIWQNSVDVGLNITVSDGGEDARIEWKNDPERTDYLPKRIVQFQIKATTTGPTDCANELIDRTTGNVKQRIDDVLDAGGAYILFNNKPLNGKQKTDRIAAIRDKLVELGKPYAKDAVILIYDSSKIKSWTNKYLSAVVAVAEWVGRPLIPGMLTWGQWSNREEYEQFAFVPDDHRSDAIAQLRDTLCVDRAHARITGLSGLGKTRLALEVFRPHEESAFLSQGVSYIDAADEPSNLSGRVSDFVGTYEGILVVDNCPLEMHKRLTEKITREESRLSLLTLDYNLDHSSYSPTINLKQLDNKYIHQLLEPVYGKQIPDLDRIVDFAQGFPLMAVLLAKARLSKSAEMGSLTEDDLLRKMLWGSDSQNAEAYKSIQACALFEHFGWERRVEDESKFIANEIARVDFGDFRSHISKFKQRGIIDTRGDYGQVIPKPLAVRLAADWWRHTQPEQIKELLNNPMPGSLRNTFCKRVEMLDFVPECKDILEEFCGAGSSFGQTEVILSDWGSRLICSFAEVIPTITVKTLNHVLEASSKKELLEIKDTVRYNLVRTLEKLCFREDAFKEAARVLLQLAAVENENSANSATRQFIQLFSSLYSGTAASPDMRLAIVKEALSSNDNTIRRVAVDALEGALRTRGFSRQLGAERQGSGKPLEEWQPKTWNEVYRYWEESLKTLTELVTTDDELSDQARLVIAKNITGLILKDQVEVLDNAIQSIVATQDSFWPEALDEINRSLKFYKKHLSPEVERKLQEWHKLLQPSTQRDRLKHIVSQPARNQEIITVGPYKNHSEIQARDLASEYTHQWKKLIPDLDVLLVGTQVNGYIFGNTIASHCDNLPAFIQIVLHELAHTTNGNPIFVIGMLDALKDRNEADWDGAMNQIVESDELCIHYPYLLLTGSCSFQRLEIFLDLVWSKKLAVNDARTFLYGSWKELLQPEDVIRFVTQLADLDPVGPWIALEFLSRYSHQDKEKWLAMKGTLQTLITSCSLLIPRETGQEGFYEWQKAVEALLDEGNCGFAELIAQKIVDAIPVKSGRFDFTNDINPILHRLFEDYAKQVWPIFSKAIEDANTRIELIFMLTDHSERKEDNCILLKIPHNELLQWCRSNPEFATEFLIEVIPITMEHDGHSEFHPLIKKLIDEFSSDSKVLKSISTSLYSFSYVNSVVPHYKRQKESFSILIDHESPTVRNWAQENLSYLDRHIKYESRRDEEREWGIR